MQQKLKLGFALYSNAEVVLLDEPTSNLDKGNSDWYFEQIDRVGRQKLLIISSNQPNEYENCDFIIDMSR